MSEQPERSDSGAPIWRHQPRNKPFEPAAGDADAIDRIDAHIRQHVGPVALVFHEVVSDLVHIDVHMVEPTAERPYRTLVTSGMSDRPMAAPEGQEAYRFAELVLCLPPDWPVTQEAFADENNYWPVRWLKLLARLPHQYDTWLFWGHTVPHGDPPTPFADNTDLCCALLLWPALFDEGFRALEVSPEKTIHFLSLVPLYREETDLKLRAGVETLLERFGGKVTELLDVRRRNFCALGKGKFKRG